MLKTDDVQLKGLPIAARFCDRCDHAVIGYVRHLVLKCPMLHEARNTMFKDLISVESRRGQDILETPGETLYVLLGKISSWIFYRGDDSVLVHCCETHQNDV